MITWLTAWLSFILENTKIEVATQLIDATFKNQLQFNWWTRLLLDYSLQNCNNNVGYFRWSSIVWWYCASFQLSGRSNDVDGILSMVTPMSPCDDVARGVWPTVLLTGNSISVTLTLNPGEPYPLLCISETCFTKNRLIELPGWLSHYVMTFGVLTFGVTYLATYNLWCYIFRHCQGYFNLWT